MYVCTHNNIASRLCMYRYRYCTGRFGSSLAKQSCAFSFDLLLLSATVECCVHGSTYGTGTYRYWYVSSCIARDESLGAVSVGIEQRNPFSSVVSAFVSLLGYIGKQPKGFPFVSSKLGTDTGTKRARAALRKADDTKDDWFVC
jgi:hypothetical protein